MSEEQSLNETHPAAESQLPDSHATPSETKAAMSPALILAFVIIVLLGGLIVMGLRNNLRKSTPASGDLKELQAELNAQRSQLNRERVALGLRPLEGGAEPLEDIAARLKKDADSMVALATSYQSMLAEKDTEFMAKSSELLRSEQLCKTLTEECARLQRELQRALVSGLDVDTVRRDLATMKTQRDALAGELSSARKELAAKENGGSKEEMDALKRRLEETLRAKDFFEAKMKELNHDLKQAKLFAESENDLLPAAVELVRSLRKLENRPELEIAAAYANLASTLGATPLRKMHFATGSSALDPSDQDAIRNLVADIPDGDLVLAIGYASETGNVDNNRTLSSDRATAVAQLYSSVKRPQQLAQAVYLGQTNRFNTSTPEENQLVEFWHIRKK